jgi:hypothetical protein
MPAVARALLGMFSPTNSALRATLGSRCQRVDIG